MNTVRPYTPADVSALVSFHARYGALEAPAKSLREQHENAECAAEFAREEYGEHSHEYRQAALLANALGRLVQRMNGVR